MSLQIGLTGGIGSGKSTVSSLFAGLGVPVIDTDVISHQLTASGGKAIPALSALFGKDYISPDGALDRARMRQLVFADSSAKAQLEAVLHPLILQETRTQASAFLAPYVVIVIPLLFESGTYEDWLDRILVVDCSEDVQLARAASRPGLDVTAVKTIMAHQIPRTERLRRSDDILQNDGSLAELEKAVIDLHHKYLHLASSSN